MSINEEGNNIINISDLLDIERRINIAKCKGIMHLEDILQNVVEAIFDISHMCKEISKMEELNASSESKLFGNDYFQETDETKENSREANSALEIISSHFNRMKWLAEEQLHVIMTSLITECTANYDIFDCQINVRLDEIDLWMEELCDMLDNAYYYERPDENYCTFLNIVRTLCRNEK